MKRVKGTCCSGRRPRAPERGLCVLPGGRGCTHHGIPPPVGAGGRTGGDRSIPLLDGQLPDPLREPNRPGEAGFVFDTICRACLLADERGSVGDALYRLAVMDEGDSVVCPQCHQPWDCRRVRRQSECVDMALGPASRGPIRGPSVNRRGRRRRGFRRTPAGRRRGPAASGPTRRPASVAATWGRCP